MDFMGSPDKKFENHCHKAPPELQHKVVSGGYGSQRLSPDIIGEAMCEGFTTLGKQLHSNVFSLWGVCVCVCLPVHVFCVCLWISCVYVKLCSLCMCVSVCVCVCVGEKTNSPGVLLSHS